MIMRKSIHLILMCFIALSMFYLSRFWIYNWWSNQGLFDISWLKPGGGLLGRWLAGTPLQTFELLIWGAGVFFLLTMLEKTLQKFKS